MNKSLLSILSASLVLASCTRDTQTEIQIDEPVTKKVVYNIFAAKDYSPTTYDNVQTTLKLTVGVASTKTSQYTKLWDTTINGHLRSFPLSHQKIQIEKTFPIVESAEQLQASHYIRYDNSGQVEQVSSFKPLVNGTVLLQEDIGL